MTTNTSWILISVCAGTASLYGQQGSISGPSSGFVFDSSARVLRQIHGIPGASIIGEPVDFGFTLAAAYVAPRLDSALVVADDGTLHLFRLTGSTGGVPAEYHLEGLSTSAARVVFSPAGTAAALETAGRVQIVKGLPDAAVIAATLTLPSVRSASAVAASARPRLFRAGSLAISDDGAYLLFAIGGSVQLIGTAGDGYKLMDTGAGALVAFAAGGHDAAIAWDGAGLVLFRDLTGASERRVLTGTAAPTGLAFSPDGRKLFVASASTQSVAAYDLGSGEPATIACDCKPGALVAMGNLFRLNEPGMNEPGRDPLWLLDDGAAATRIVFVPARVVSDK